MLTSRPLHLVRLLVLATAAAFLIAVPAVVMAGSPASATGKSTSRVTKRHAKGGAAEEQSELNEHLQKLTQRLKLTDDQVAKVRAILQAKTAQANELRAKYKGLPVTAENKAAREKAHQDLHADIDAKFAQVLTADQLTEYKKMRAEHMKSEGAKEEKEEAEKEPKN